MEKSRMPHPKGLASFRWSTWGQQWGAMIGALMALIAMVILLSSFDDKPVFSWNGVTLNTITSILSVTVKSAVLFVIAECMAQWKWILFAREQRPLIDFDRLDGATRGPLGSLRLLLNTKGALVAQFGAVLTLIALALDPFAQQLVQLGEVTSFQIAVNGSVALLPRATSYSSGEFAKQAKSAIGTSEDGTTVIGYSQNSTTAIAARMSNAISSGFYKSTRDHASAFILPNGHFIANVDGTDLTQKEPEVLSYIATSFGTGNPNKTVSMMDIDTLLWSMSFIYPNMKAYNDSKASSDSTDRTMRWPNVPMIASEVALYYCVKNITASVTDNKLHEDTTEVLGVTRTKDSWDAGLDKDRAMYQTPPDEVRALEFHEEWSAEEYNPLQLQVPGHGDLFSVTEIAIKSLSAHFQGLFRHGAWHNSTSIREPLSAIPGMADAVAYNAATYGPLTEKPLSHTAQPLEFINLVAPAGLEGFHESDVLEAVAESMTNEMRRSFLAGDRNRNMTDTAFEEGLTGVPVVLYRVEWVWIALHATMLVSSCLFLMLTIRSSGHGEEVPLWKSSSLGAIRRGHDIGDLLTDAGDTVADMEATARKLQLKACRDDAEEATPTRGGRPQQGAGPE